MKPSHSSWGVLGATFVYLHDERVEVGQVQVGFIEELDRMSYRDVRRLRSWKAGRPAYKIGALIAFLISLFLAAVALVAGETSNAGIFFGAGALVLVGGLAAMAGWLTRTGKRHTTPNGSATKPGHVTAVSLAFRGLARRRSRSWRSRR